MLYNHSYFRRCFINIFEKIEKFVKKVFKTTLEIFLEALRLSPNAQGYVSGSITELLLKKEIEEKYGCEVIRIREKWEGKKHQNHHGDFYFRKDKNGPWYVLESKGIKSNSEKWHKLYNFEKLKNFLLIHNDKLPWIIRKNNDIENQIILWIYKELPRFNNEYKENLYDYEEIQKYLKIKTKRETDKSKSIDALKTCSRDEINKLINERLTYINEKIRLLETHFVSGKSASSLRTQATPRWDEFNIISIDIFLRYSDHKFLFANPRMLETSRDDENHLQQNYIMGFILVENGKENIYISEEWTENFHEVYDFLDEKDAINENEMRIDTRNEDNE